MTNTRLLAKVNEAYGLASRDCNGPAMLILGELHRELVKIGEGHREIPECDIIRVCQSFLSDS